MEREKDDSAKINGYDSISGKCRSNPVSLLELNNMISHLVCVPETTSVWVTAEISDFSLRRHAYLELVQKDDFGDTVAKARATIWANTFRTLDLKFRNATGTPIAAGQKVMFLVSATFHPAYGFSLNITDVNPEFTAGDVLLRRRQSIQRLTEEGIIDMNRTLTWSETPMRLAVISSGTAAGYGDFVKQLHCNAAGLRFRTVLFEATVQGAKAPASIINALEQIAADAGSYDGVVLIRGGGAADDLSCFEDYDLAANIAQFPLPVIIGIGHEKDVTLLDYVANMRVKTPTAAAAWLTDRATDALDRLMSLGEAIFRQATDAMAESKMFLSRASLILENNVRRIIDSEKSKLRIAATRLTGSTAAVLAREKSRLDASETLMKMLSPEATLRRGYTMTLLNGRSSFNPDELKPGDTIETIFKDNKSITSKI